MMQREMGVVLAAVVAVAAGTAAGQQVVYSNLTPVINDFDQVETVQSFEGGEKWDDIQIVGGGILQEIKFGVVNQPFFGGGPAPSEVTLTIYLATIGGDLLPDLDGAPLLTHTFTTPELGAHMPSILSVDLTSHNLVIPNDATLMVGMSYSNFNFKHVKAVPGAATVGSSTDVLRPDYFPDQMSNSGDLMYEISVVPAPAAAGLFGLGGLMAMRRRR